jgi:hypothetical protein
MSTQELERQFVSDVRAAIAIARAGDVDGDEIARNLRGLARDVALQWDRELDRRNAERIKSMEKSNV